MITNSLDCLREVLQHVAELFFYDLIDYHCEELSHL
jgi:hypothetical protein